MVDMLTPPKKCPLCDGQAIAVLSKFSVWQVDCIRCGKYCITLQAQVNLRTSNAAIRSELHLLSGLARERCELAESDEDLLRIQTDTIESFQKLAPSTEAERITRFLQLAANRAKRHSSSEVRVNRLTDYFMAFTRDGDEFWRFLLDLENRSLIRRTIAASAGLYQFTLTISGREYLEKRSARESGSFPNKEAKTLEQLLAEDEGSCVERKASLRWDYKLDNVNPDLEKAIAKAVAGFLNIRQGGYLLIGIGDDGSCLGLDKDYATFKSRPNWDGFQQHLMNTLGKCLGNACLTSVHPRRETKDGREICVVTVELGSGPTFLIDRKSSRKRFYVRSGNTTKELDGNELIEYTREMWPRK